MSAGAAIVSDKQLGDVLLLQPAAAHLARATGKPTALFVREAFRPMIQLMPGCIWGPETAGTRYDQVWATSWSSRAVWQAFRLKTRKRLLIVNKDRHLRWWYRLVFHQVRLEPPSAEYWARYTWRVISGEPAEAFNAPRLQTPPEDWRHANCPDGPFLLINPTAAWSRKFWGAEQWAQTMTRLSQEHSLPLVIAGGGSEKEKAHCQAIADACAVPVINLAGQTSMQQYLHLLSKARLVLCIDGAASHLAQAFGIATVTVFGPTHHGKWHWPTARNRVLAASQFLPQGGQEAPSGPLSATGVPVDAMLREAEALLAGL